LGLKSDLQKMERLKDEISALLKSELAQLPDSSHIERTQPQANFIKQKNDIETLTSINGITIEEIEKRARPKAESQVGFLGSTESFKDVLREDWTAVERMKISHIELCEHLNKILEIAKDAPASNDPWGIKTIRYRPLELENNTIQVEEFQTLEVVLLSTRGRQPDLFTPPEGQEREVNTLPWWSDEPQIRNPANGVTITLTSGTYSYMKEFGFYEGGGEENRYRVDPVKVMALLTGKPVQLFKDLVS
jgi:hypothetical protein